MWEMRRKEFNERKVEDKSSRAISEEEQSESIRKWCRQLVLADSGSMTSERR